MIRGRLRLTLLLFALGLLMVMTTQETARAQIPSRGQVKAQLRNDSKCGVDFWTARSLFEQLYEPAASALDSRDARTLRQALEAGADAFRESNCLITCLHSRCDSRALLALEALRTTTLAFYKNPNINPIDRRGAMTRVALVTAGPDLWKTGFETMASFRLAPQPGMTWRKLHRDSGIQARFDQRAWATGFSQAGVLRSMADQQTNPEVRFDVAAFISAASVPETERHDFFRTYELDMRTYKAFEWKVDAAESALRESLGRFLEESGLLPSHVNDWQGRLRPEVCPGLFDSGGEVDQAIACLFQGWPGIRIRDYEVHGEICLMRVVGFGFEYEKTWWFAFE